MGADWVRFRIPPELDAQDVRERICFVSENYAYGHQRFFIPEHRDDDATRERWSQDFSWLTTHLKFPLDELDYWAHRNLTNPLKLEPGEDVSTIDACRVCVIARNPVFPVEWRNEAYRTILPDELAAQVSKWKSWGDEVRQGQWQRYLRDLYLFDCINDDHQFEQINGLYEDAQESLTRTNAWCLKDRIKPVRKQILSSNLASRLALMREQTACPAMAKANRTETPTRRQLEREAEFLTLRQQAAEQIREWNRFVPAKWKHQFPLRRSFEEFLALIEDSWLDSFFRWCDHLIENDNGLFLWA